MSIHIILGKPGSGKSLYATSRLIDELANGKRNVVTNLPIRPDRLNQYLQDKYPDRDCRMIQRLRMLTDDEMRQFWLYRGPDAEAGTSYPSDLPEFSAWTTPFDGSDSQDYVTAYRRHVEREQEAYEDAKAELAKRREQFIKYLGDLSGGLGVAYFLDEAHIAFNARDWASLGRGAIHYLSQHRKLNDIVWPITQSPGNLDKQFRSVAEDFTVLRNEYMAKYGPFRGRGRFVRRIYLSEPTGNAEPFDKGTFTLDKEGIASCYDTAKGIGVHGTTADIGKRAKGISIWWAFAGAFGIAALVGLVPFLLGKAAQSVMQAKVEDAGLAVGDAIGGDSSRQRAAPFDFFSPQHSSGHVASGQSIEPVATGYVIYRGRVTVQMSDGSTRIEQTDEDGVVLGEIHRVMRNAVYENGVKRYLMPKPRPEVFHVEQSNISSPVTKN